LASTILTAPRARLGQTALLAAMACLTAVTLTVMQQQRLREPSVSLRLSQYLSEPRRAPSLYEIEDALGPRTLLDRWNPVVREAAARFHIPPLWLRAVMRNETGGRTVGQGDKPITSRAGALGIMQLMPETYSQMAERHDLGGDPAKPRDNIFAAAAYLSWLKSRYGFPGMFGAYNFGPGNWEDHLHRRRALPSETRNYLKQITAYLKEADSDIVNAVHLTRPDGRAVAINIGAISAIVAAPRGQYAPGSQTVIFMGRKRQAVKESVVQVAERLRIQGIAL
jgi:soluble lytic murein transglycosylase-like protein